MAKLSAQSGLDLNSLLDKEKKVVSTVVLFNKEEVEKTVLRCEGVNRSDSFSSTAVLKLLFAGEMEVRRDSMEEVEAKGELRIADEVELGEMKRRGSR